MVHRKKEKAEGQEGRKDGTKEVNSFKTKSQY
jgi:hypothetical protein